MHQDNTINSADILKLKNLITCLANKIPQHKMHGGMRAYCRPCNKQPTVIFIYLSDNNQLGERKPCKRDNKVLIII